MGALPLIDSRGKRLPTLKPASTNPVLAERLTRSTFRVWRLLEDCMEGSVAHCVEAHGSTLAEVTQSLAGAGSHKWKYAVEETDTISGKITLRHYVIQRGSWAGQYERGAYGDYAPRKAYPHKATLLATIELAEPFAPKLKWQWTPGADVVSKADFIELNQEQGAG